MLSRELKILLNKKRSNKNLLKDKYKIFTKEYLPYEIGFVSREKLKVKTFGKLQW